MTEKIKHDVSGTAFVVNYSRSRMVNISHDRYAHLWVTPQSISLWHELSHNVYPHDDLNLSLRNRFYLEHIKKFMATNINCVLISIAAGFDNYPFLIDECKSIEIDLPNIIDYKKTKVEQWMKEDKLPKRNIQFIPIDLTRETQRINLKEQLKMIVGQNPSLVLMEGITYYLEKEVLEDIFNILAEVQQIGSLLALDYWKPDALDYPVMLRLKDYLDKQFGKSGAVWNLFNKAYIKEIKSYNEIESTDIATLELEYSDTRIFQGKDQKIPVHFSVLIRQ